MLRVLVIDETHSRAADVCAALAMAGCQVAAILPTSLDLVEQVEKLTPDIVLIDTDSPSRDTLEHLGVMDERAPRPVIMLAHDNDRNTIRSAMQAGVSAYIVDGLDPSRVQSVIDVAAATFDTFQGLRRERDEAQRKLADRKTIDRAKGILMKARDMDEDAAYKALRKLAMDRGRTLAAVAQDVIDMSHLLG